MKNIRETKKEILKSLKGDREIVINKCFGGFGLSHKAIMRYAELKGIKLYVEKDEYSFNSYYKVPPAEYKKYYEKWRKEDGDYRRINAKDWCFNDGDIKRDDEELINVVKELGSEANGKCAKLEIVKIPFEVDWEIDEYDGMETIREKHRSWN